MDNGLTMRNYHQTACREGSYRSQPSTDSNPGGDRENTQRKAWRRAWPPSLKKRIRRKRHYKSPFKKGKERSSLAFPERSRLGKSQQSGSIIAAHQPQGQSPAL
ncbi:hypothetical protein C7M84_004848 [Penaeus vannamei]|uniref:Uncharacterized protein n=1 Tax=Penaeus vannamei TaxID=6689 RepID=A0A3R7P644_PENVA|nr:hypothetical protein C7M84_004848 [Penaeus vannamei]